MKVRSLTLCAMFTALICLCSWLTVPFPGVPFTLQTFAVSLCLLVLGGKRGCASIFAYLMLGLCGLPVFSGFQGGFSALIGPTGGFLMGFLLGALGCWGLSSLGVKPVPAAAACLAISHLAGCLWYAFGYLAGSASLGAAALQCVPFLIPDALKLALAWLVAKRLKPFAACGSKKR